MCTRQVLRNKIGKEFKFVLDPTNKLVGTATDMLLDINRRGTVKTNSSPREIAIVFMLAMAYGQFISIKVLCEDGMGHMACIVLRSLLELLIKFGWILGDTTGVRAEKYLYWSSKERYDEMVESPSRFSDEEKKAITSSYQKVKHLFSYKQKGKVKDAGKWHSPYTIKDLAANIGLADHRFLSRVTHIDPTYLSGRVRNLKIEHDPGFDKHILNEALVMSFTYFLNICIKYDKMFSLGMSKTLAALTKVQKGFPRAGQF